MFDQPGAVILFSGRTDSLCALIDAVAHRRLKPVLVSHWATGLEGRQFRLRQAVRQRIDGWSFPQVQVELHRHGDGDGESS